MIASAYYLQRVSRPYHRKREQGEHRWSLAISLSSRDELGRMGGSRQLEYAVQSTKRKDLQRKRTLEICRGSSGYSPKSSTAFE